jgi:hypothetical protein
LGSPGGGEIAKQIYQFEKRLFGFASMPLRAKTFPTEAQDESRRWLAELEMHAVLDFVPAANALALLGAVAVTRTGCGPKEMSSSVRNITTISCSVRSSSDPRQVAGSPIRK